MKKIAFIKTKIFSKIDDINIILVEGHPLISYVVRACKESKVFDDIYVVGEEKNLKKLSEMFGVQFVSDIPNISNDTITVVTSIAAPLIQPATLVRFMKQLELVGELIAGNSILGKNPTKSKKENFELSKIESLYAESLEDLELIEGALLHKRQGYKTAQFKLPENFKSIEHKLKELMCRDGVDKFDPSEINLRIRNVDEIKKRMGKAPWCHFLFYTATDQTALICQLPGEGARKHSHVTHDEWWMVMDGTFEWRLEDGKVIVGNKGDIVYLPRGTVHTIVCTSKEPGLRLACGARDMEHIYF